MSYCFKSCSRVEDDWCEVKNLILVFHLLVVNTLSHTEPLIFKNYGFTTIPKCLKILKFHQSVNILRILYFLLRLWLIPFSNTLWFDYFKWTDQITVNTHYCSPVLKDRTVIRCWKYCNKLSLPKKLITLLDNLRITTN